MNALTLILLQAILAAQSVVASTPIGSVLRALADWILYLQGQGIAGAGAVAVTGSGTLTTAQLANKTINFVGVLAGNTTLQLPAIFGAEMVFTNTTTGLFTLQLKDVANKSIFLLPNQSKIVGFDVNGAMRADQGSLVLARALVDLAAAVGNNDTPIAVLPAGTVAYQFSMIGVQNVAGGVSTLSVGGNAARDDLLVGTSVPTAAGGSVGTLPADWGTAVNATSGQAQALAVDTPIFLRNVVAGIPTTAGQVYVQVVARVISDNIA